MSRINVRTGVAVLAVFVLWMVLNFIEHGVILGPTYGHTPNLWRPMSEYRHGLSTVVVLITAACFVYLYAQLISEKSTKSALTYGLVLGIAQGTSMGYGSYSAMPMPYVLALGWFLGSIVQYVAAGWVVSLIVKPDAR